jgi:hypothetical protein
MVEAKAGKRQLLFGETRETLWNYFLPHAPEIFLYDSVLWAIQCRQHGSKTAKKKSR